MNKSIFLPLALAISTVPTLAMEQNLFPQHVKVKKISNSKISKNKKMVINRALRNCSKTFLTVLGSMAIVTTAIFSSQFIPEPIVSIKWKPLSSDGIQCNGPCHYAIECKGLCPTSLLANIPLDPAYEHDKLDCQESCRTYNLCDGQTCFYYNVQGEITWKHSSRYKNKYRKLECRCTKDAEITPKQLIAQEGHLKQQLTDECQEECRVLGIVRAAGFKDRSLQCICKDKNT